MLLFLSTGSLYGSGMADNLYEGSLGVESGLDNLDDVIMSQSGSGSHGNSPRGSLVNPIDKLYSMQNSYFNAE